MNWSKGKLIKDQYKIDRVLGKGASAVVYLAEDLKNNRNVALKVQNENEEFSNMDKRFKLEAETLLSLNHPNIVETYDFFNFDDRRILVMEYVRGKTIDKLIEERNFISNKDTVKYSIQIFEALKKIHAQGIMHRDLKPANIVLNLENKIKLMDFGIVQASTSQDLTKQASIIGTIQYLAPEIFKGEKATPSSEIFSVGVLMYKMLTGVVPFYGVNHEDTARQILLKEPERISRLNPDIDLELELIVMKMIEKDYINRYRNSEAAIEILNRYINKIEGRMVKIKPIIRKDKKKRERFFLKIMRK
ncbi:MAG: hypothetical protein HPAVJP_4380 [Candidatus Hepatoplasma vulgare]|nr:MAG: hypothetical protein HPAVJP_4380 [Candidatus Hepatoplasma sp.]